MRAGRMRAQEPVRDIGTFGTSGTASGSVSPVIHSAPSMNANEYELSPDFCRRNSRRRPHYDHGSRAHGHTHDKGHLTRISKIAIYVGVTAWGLVMVALIRRALSV